jgi:hypothetical protein
MQAPAGSFDSELEKELWEKNPYLFEELQKIKYAAARVFAEGQEILWYTDHGLQHSHRIVQRVTVLLQPLHGTQRLSGEELFVLLASCYLHDIGMYYFKTAGKTYPYSPTDFDLIRRRHPEVSARLIMENAAYLDDPQQAIELPIPEAFVDAISLVCQAHGTNYFSASLHRLATVPTTTDAVFRGPLVAALLLMGDEMDLDSQRSASLLTRLSKWADYPPESILHIYQHHYIRNIKVLQEGGRCRLEVSFQFPPDSLGYAHDLIYWVAAKLLRQCRLTHGILAPYGIIWGNRIKIVRHPDSASRKALPDEALPYLAEITAERKVVDRQTLKGQLKPYTNGEFAATTAILVQGQRDSDHDILAQWLLSSCHRSRGGTSYECLEYDQLGGYHIIHITDMVRRLRARSERPVGIIRNLHLADPAVIKWLFGKGFTQLLMEEGQPPLAMVAFTDGGLPNDAMGSFILEPLGEYQPEDLRQHLKKIGCPADHEQSILIDLEPNLPPGYITGKMDSHLSAWVPITFI